ncbi:MAG: glycosyltransferase family 4 protein [Deltaproteobacteria bacterium]|nr:glycosyltransferase family 4 protein [Deltaproteobacteria bacterium]
MQSVGAVRHEAPESEAAAHGRARRLRLLLDARKLGDGGIGVYIENLIAGLIESGEVELTAIVKPAAARTLAAQVAVIEDSASSYSFDEMFRLARRIDFSNYDLFHEPHYTLPYGIPIPTVVTIHDLIHLQFPEKPFIPYLAGFLIRSALRRADTVVTVSRASQQKLAEFARNKPAIVSKISVVPNALDPYFLEGRSQGEAPHQRCCGKYFLSILSNLKPHKGVADLLDAFRRVREKLETQAAQEKSGRQGKVFGDLKLVLLGEGTQSMVDREHLLDLASTVKGVKIVGRVSKEELRSWYRGAQALVVASREEGFCLPVLEAQAVGIPVISRPVAAVCDLLTSNDYRCEDFEVQSLADAMYSFLQNRPVPKLNEPNHAALSVHFTPYMRSNIARSILSVYRRTLSGPE